MSLCKKKKEVRPPLQPREGQYKKTNAYTKKCCFQQILTLFLAFLVVVLHSIFLVAAIIQINHPILYIMLAFNYFFIVCLIFVYIKITTFDPVDSFITNPELAQLQRYQKIRSYCHLCRSFIHQRSYHCKRCGRCTQNFDHHCVYLNSCIGSTNYQLFLIILLLYIIFLFNNVGQAIWVFVAARKNQQVRAASISEWMSIAIVVICTLQIVATITLLTFHCYISCCLDVTTLMFMVSEDKSQLSKKQKSNKIQSSSSAASAQIQQASPANLHPTSKSQGMQPINSSAFMV